MNRTAKVVIACLGVVVIALAFVALRRQKAPDPVPYDALLVPSVGLVTARIGHAVTDHGLRCLSLTDASIVVSNNGQPMRLVPYSQAFSSAFGNSSLNTAEACDVALIQPIAKDSILGKLIADAGRPQAAAPPPVQAPSAPTQSAPSKQLRKKK